MYTRKAYATREAPRRGQSDDQLETREGQAGRIGVAEGFVVPLKLGNAGGGKGPQFKTDAIRGEGAGRLGNLSTPGRVQDLQMASHAKTKAWRSCPREAMGRAAEVVAPSSSIRTDGGYPVAQVNDLSRSLTAFDPISTLVVVVEMSKAKWLVSGAVPGIERQPLKKLEPDATALLRLIERWRNEAVRAGRPISRIALAYEAGRDGFWLARLLIARGIEAHVIHSASVAVSRERKRAKTDRLDAAMLMRVFLGWLRGERGHCGMVAIPTMEEEDARRPSRERECLVNERSRITNRVLMQVRRAAPRRTRGWLEASGMEARKGGDASCGSVHDSPAPKADAAPYEQQLVY